MQCLEQIEKGGDNIQIRWRWRRDLAELWRTLEKVAATWEHDGGGEEGEILGKKSLRWWILRLGFLLL